MITAKQKHREDQEVSEIALSFDSSVKKRRLSIDLLLSILLGIWFLGLSLMPSFSKFLDTGTWS